MKNLISYFKSNKKQSEIERMGLELTDNGLYKKVTNGSYKTYRPTSSLELELVSEKKQRFTIYYKWDNRLKSFIHTSYGSVTNTINY